MIDWKRIKDIQPEEGTIEIIAYIKNHKNNDTHIEFCLYYNEKVDIIMHFPAFSVGSPCIKYNLIFKKENDFNCDEYELTHWDYCNKPKK